MKMQKLNSAVFSFAMSFLFCSHVAAASEDDVPVLVDIEVRFSIDNTLRPKSYPRRETFEGPELQIERIVRQMLPDMGYRVVDKESPKPMTRLSIELDCRTTAIGGFRVETPTPGVVRQSVRFDQWGRPIPHAWFFPDAQVEGNVRFEARGKRVHRTVQGRFRGMRMKDQFFKRTLITASEQPREAPFNPAVDDARILEAIVELCVRCEGPDRVLRLLRCEPSNKIVSHAAILALGRAEAADTLMSLVIGEADGTEHLSSTSPFGEAFVLARERGARALRAGLRLADARSRHRVLCVLASYARHASIEEDSEQLHRAQRAALRRRLRDLSLRAFRLLLDDSASVRRATLDYIHAVPDKRAIPWLRKALKTETDQAIRKDMEDAIQFLKDQPGKSKLANGRRPGCG